MYSKPRIKGEVKIYRLPLQHRIRVGCLDMFLLPSILVMMWAFPRNTSMNLLESIGSTVIFLLLIVWLLTLTYYVLFVIQLRISPSGGEFRGVRQRVKFTWDDAYDLSYELIEYGKSYYRLNLLIRNSTVETTTLPAWLRIMVEIFPIISAKPHSIPLGHVYRYDPIGLDTRAPDRKEMLGYLEYFITTPLGKDLLYYAPHVFRMVKDRYFNIVE